MRIVPSRNGWLWLRQGWLLFLKHPAAWLLFILLLLILSTVVNWIPMAGPFVSSVLVPGFSVGIMLACARAEQGNAPDPRALVDAFRQAPAPLLTLGGIYLVCMLLALGVSMLADGGAFFNRALFGTAPPEEALKDGSLFRALLLATLASAPVFMAFLFAPLLAAWQQLGPWQSLFYSFFASLRNWRALTVYALAIFGGLMSVSLAIAMLGVPLGADVRFISALTMGALLVLLPALTASLYFAYRDIFPVETQTPVETTTPDPA